MAKIEVGNLYRVGMRSHSESGNVIRIKEAIVRRGSPGFRYEIVEGKKPSAFNNTFSADSLFGTSLIPVPEMIVIYRKDNKVVALDKATGKEGVARCAPGDTFDFETGAKLAFKRLVGEDTAAEPVKPVEPKFKVGEFVRIVSAKSGSIDKIHGFPIGQIVKVVGVRGDDKYDCEGVYNWIDYAFGIQIVNPEHIEKLEEA